MATSRFRLYSLPRIPVQSSRDRPLRFYTLFFSFLFLFFANEREKLIISQGVDDGFDAKMWNWKGMEIMNLSYIIRLIIDEKNINFDIR